MVIVKQTHRLKKERVFLAYEKKLLYVIDSTNMSVPAIIGLSPVIAIMTADSWRHHHRLVTPATFSDLETKININQSKNIYSRREETKKKH